MATWVVDASVILKWLLADPQNEPDTLEATVLMESLVTGEHEVVQPPHWLAEVAAVMARLSPATALDDVLRVQAMEWPLADAANVWTRAVQLAIDTNKHVFDTLYHAVALEHADAILVTADERYRKQGARFGRIIGLKDWAGTR
jgi:predicted nucleic acid-binding protein